MWQLFIIINFPALNLLIILIGDKFLKVIYCNNNSSVISIWLIDFWQIYWLELMDSYWIFGAIERYVPDAPLLTSRRHIVPCFFWGDTDFNTDAMPPIVLENMPKPVPTNVPNQSQ